MRKLLARYTERIGLWWAINTALWGRKYPPPSTEEACELARNTSRNSFYDAHTPGKKNVRNNTNG